VPNRFCKIAIDTPLRRLFDYRSPIAMQPGAVQPGVRVRVPFGRQRVVGIVVSLADHTDVPEAKLRDVLEVLDTAPVFAPAELALLNWAADYYHHPVGEVFAAALPRLLRAGHEAIATQVVWSCADGAAQALVDGQLRRAPRQLALLQLISAGELNEEQLDAALPGWRAAARELLKRQLLHRESLRKATPMAVSRGQVPQRDAGPALNEAQRLAVAAVAAPGKPGAFLLDGVTGSGKTEVYLQLAAQVLARGDSVLVLCPEIGLTPQLVNRFGERFEGGIAALHSGLTDGQRLDAWRAAASGAARIVIGTRSAVFAPLASLGLIIVDEEHDSSYKQQEGGFRYSARDLALLRGQRAQVPVLLGSATPSFESLHNVAQGRMTRLHLPERAGDARPPSLTVVDMRAHAVHRGLSMPLLTAMDRHLAAGAQVLLYLNRRGYAPTLLCTSCGWTAQCRSCDARLTVHQRADVLACHHCGAQQKRPERCPRCGYEVRPLGHGTERVEETLAERFPGIAVERFDRDILRAQQALEGAISRVHSGVARILVGTQMLTKGHHFPDVTLVGILNADQSLFSTDFRATERLAQTIVQVAGRAGRADRPGEVMIQSQYPDHPLLRTLLTQGYEGFAASAMNERDQARWPPFLRMAVLRASDTTPQGALKFLGAARDAAGIADGVELRGPVPAAMTRRADRYHAQLLIESGQRARLQRFLSDWIPKVDVLATRGKLRWVLDVDPLEVF
jgi:primosomal protein N' (replication factor Y) (superfamily II helicase)